MKLRQRNDHRTLPAGLAATLDDFRQRRAFDADAYLDDKVALLNTYLTHHQLSALVVAVSGGVDSAVVAALTARAAAAPRSPLRRLTWVTLPVTSGAVTGQADATRRAQHAMADAATLAGDDVTIDALTIDLTATYDTLEHTTRTALRTPADPWARGQVAATVRTPALYYLTSMLTAAGTPAAVAGTTNRDEGAWLGYVGKASDGMVDLQLISDIHKSEVYACAELLGTHHSITACEPTGDMYDGAVDTDVFGAPYDYVELYHHLLTHPDVARDAPTRWGDDDHRAHEQWAAALERLHAANAHKYLVGSPAVHLDLYDASVPGGWPDHRWRP